MAEKQGIPKDSLFNTLKHHSCALCYRRKVKCDKKNPCSYCVARQVPCVPTAPPAPKPRKKRFPEAELLARLRRYEAALKSYGADIDSLNNDADQTGTKSTEQGVSGFTSHGEFYSANQSSYQERQQTLESLSIEDEAEQDALGSPSPDETKDGPILSLDYDPFDAEGSILFSTVGASVDFPSFHPPPVQIFRLWQIFLDNVHPALKLFPAQIVQQQLLESAANLSTITYPMHGLFLAIYSNAVVSMTNHDCMTVLGEDRWTLISRYTTGAKYALHKSEFLRTTDLTILQAFVLYLHSVAKLANSRSFLCLTALAERIAKRDGLHQNPRPRSISPYYEEMRRRLWWQIVLLDNRAAEVCGVGTTVSYEWNTKLPVNVNDSDLSPEMDTLPLAHNRATDMIFCIVRCATTEFLRQLRAKGSGGRWGEFGNSDVSLSRKLEVISSFERDIYDKYLAYCHTGNPLHNLTRYYAMQSMAKMRIVAYSAVIRRKESLRDVLMTERQEKLMEICLEAIETYNKFIMDQSMARFAWFLASNIPFIAYVHLLLNLQERTEGVLVARAWKAITDEHGIFARGDPVKLFAPKPLQLKSGAILSAFAGLVVRAWEARKRGFGYKHHVPEPPVVEIMRVTLSSSRNGDVDYRGCMQSHDCEMQTTKPSQMLANTQIVDWPAPTPKFPSQPPTNSAVCAAPVTDPSVVPSQNWPTDHDLSTWDYWQDMFAGDAAQYTMDWNQTTFPM